MNGFPLDTVLLALLAACLFGSALVLTQFGLRHFPPIRGAAISVPSAAVLLWLISPAFVDWSDWHGHAAAIFIGVGLLFPATVTLLTFEANRRMGPSVAGALGNLAPLFALLLAAVLLGEAPGVWQAFGIAAVMGGVLLLSVDRRHLDTSWPLWALALPLTAAAVRGLVQPVAKLGLADWPAPVAAVVIGYTASAVVVGSFAALRPPAVRTRGPLRHALWFVAVGACNAGAVIAMYSALVDGSVVLVSPLVATYPLVTMALSAILLPGMRIGPRVLAGVAVTVAGVALLLVT